MPSQLKCCNYYCYYYCSDCYCYLHRYYLPNVYSLFLLLFKLFSISVRYSYHQLDASTTLQCGEKSPSFCVVDNEITTNSIYYTTIPSNGDAHGIQTTIFYLVLKTYTIQLCYTPARPAFLSFFFPFSVFCLQFASHRLSIAREISRQKHTTFTFETQPNFYFC